MIHFPNLSTKERLSKNFDLSVYVQNQKLRGTCQVKLAYLGLDRKLNKGEMQATYDGTPLHLAPEVVRGD